MREMEKEHFFDESMNSLKAGHWEIFFAKIFGTRYTGTDEMGITVDLVKWRRKIYLLGISK